MSSPSSGVFLTLSFLQLVISSAFPLSKWCAKTCPSTCVLFFKWFHLFIHETHRERGRGIGRGRSRLHSGTWCTTQSQNPRITTWAKGRHSTRATQAPSTCVLNPMSLLPLLGHRSILFIASPSFPHPTHLKFFLIWNQKKKKKVHPITTQLLFTTRTFKENALLSLVLTMTTSLNLTASLRYTFGHKVFSWGMLPNRAEKGWDLESENRGPDSGSAIYYHCLHLILLWVSNELIFKEDTLHPTHAHMCARTHTDTLKNTVQISVKLLS